MDHTIKDHIPQLLDQITGLSIDQVLEVLAASYPGQVAHELTQAADELLSAWDAPDRSTLVDLAEPFADPLREMVATLLYRYDAHGHSYRQIQSLVTQRLRRG